MIDYWRSIPGGVCTSNRGYEKSLEYIEFGQMAHFHASIGIDTTKAANADAGNYEYTWAYIILAYVDITLKFAYKFLSKIQYSWPITVKVILKVEDFIKINYAVPGYRNHFDLDNMSSFSPDKQLLLLNTEIAPAQLIEDETLMLSVADNLFWAFGLGWDKPTVSNWLSNTASQHA
ncbi:MAG: hypothetical protein H8E29_02295 [Anaerolineales bacterium]|uniref:Uncharacterized protein n=1 Tax=Candidatus Desulfolinea nitratireducens TaxID=2841698 RepID=A0A8J6NG50_9CHLR|nr:hypothetical protein [Candidatus Desulfolinea nitratireducens]